MFLSVIGYRSKEVGNLRSTPKSQWLGVASKLQRDGSHSLWSKFARARSIVRLYMWVHNCILKQWFYYFKIKKSKQIKVVPRSLLIGSGPLCLGQVQESPKPVLGLACLGRNRSTRSSDPNGHVGPGLHS